MPKSYKIGLIGFPKSGKTELLLALRRLHPKAIPGWPRGDFDPSFIRYIDEIEDSEGRTQATQDRDFRFANLRLFGLTCSDDPTIRGVKIEVETFDVSGEALRYVGSGKLRGERVSQDDQEFQDSLDRLEKSLASCDVVLFCVSCMSEAQGSDKRSKETFLILNKLRRQEPLPRLVVLLTCADAISESFDLGPKLRDTMLEAFLPWPDNRAPRTWIERTHALGVELLKSINRSDLLSEFEQSCPDRWSCVPVSAWGFPDGESFTTTERPVHPKPSHVQMPFLIACEHLRPLLQAEAQAELLRQEELQRELRLQEERRRAEEAQKAEREEARRRALKLEQERRANEAAAAELIRAAEEQKRLDETEEKRKKSQQIQILTVTTVALLIGSAIVAFLFSPQP